MLRFSQPRIPLAIERSIRSYILSSPNNCICFRHYATKNEILENDPKKSHDSRPSNGTRQLLMTLRDRQKTLKELKDRANGLETRKKKKEKGVSKDNALSGREKTLTKGKSGNKKLKGEKTSRRSKLAKSTKEPTSKIKDDKDELVKQLNTIDGGWTSGWGEDKLKPSSSTDIDEDSAPIADVLTRSKHGLIFPPTRPHVLEDIPSPPGSRPIATLGPGLDRALFNPGVQWLQDPRTGEYNFDKRYQAIPDVTKFDFEKSGRFVRASQDEDLHDLAVKHKKQFASSTSSLTGLLSHVYFLISQDRPVDTSTFSKDFRAMPNSFTPGARVPVTLLFRQRDGVYAIDSVGGDDKELYERFNILMWQGTMLERFLTDSQEVFAGYFVGDERGGGGGGGDATRVEDSKEPIEGSEKKERVKELEQENKEEKLKEAYRYSKSDVFVMRSQLDGHDPRLPGTGVFDIKTRAALPLRYDVLNYKEHTGYHILRTHGALSSFEREYYDLVRAAFLKYSFQTRIGNMDGVYVAYHNTARIFGFQYVPVEEMDERLFGGTGGYDALSRNTTGKVGSLGVGRVDEIMGKRAKGDRIFERCVRLMEVICQEVISCYPGMTVTCTAETLENKDSLKLWVQPAAAATAELATLPDGSATPSIVELDVRVESYLDEERVSGNLAVDEVMKPWTLRYTISRSPSSPSKIRKRLERAKLRQQFEYNLPAGVPFDQLLEYWKTLGWERVKRHGGGGDVGKGENEGAVDSVSKEGEIDVQVKERMFREADPWVEVLRELSRLGLKKEKARESEGNQNVAESRNNSSS